jgi:hypothetical protein
MNSYPLSLGSYINLHIYHLFINLLFNQGQTKRHLSLGTVNTKAHLSNEMKWLCSVGGESANTLKYYEGNDMMFEVCYKILEGKIRKK